MPANAELYRQETYAAQHLDQASCSDRGACNDAYDYFRHAIIVDCFGQSHPFVGFGPRVVCPDLSGQGFSDRPINSADYSLRAALGAKRRSA
jgi:hypothetical protein